jgi:hypothetical protein
MISNGAAAIAAVCVEAETIEQQFPCGERRQRQRCRLGKIQRLRLASGDAFVNNLLLRVAARPGDVAGVIHRVALLEECHRIADRDDRAGGIPAEHFRLRLDLGFWRTHLRIDRIDGDCFDAHQQIVIRSCRIRQDDVDKRCRIVDRQIVGQANGFHAGAPRVAQGRRFWMWGKRAVRTSPVPLAAFGSCAPQTRHRNVSCGTSRKQP